MSNTESPKMMHSTYFTLPMGSTPANRESYMGACADYLSSSDGMLSFWIASLAEDMFRVQNDRTFNISMNQVFLNKSKFDLYNGSDKRHDQFVVEVNRWAPGTGRRVFDSYLTNLIERDCKIPGCDEPPRFVHNVYFSLTDNSENSVEKFIAICMELLSDHPGICTFAIGTLADLHRDVSMNNYDVAMNILWQSKADYSNYLTSDSHDEFGPATAGMISNIQVFDSYLKETPPTSDSGAS